jgi:threonine/homoserine/homoserine lactone efflux protein
MSFLFFLVETVVISLSGVMAPGPMTAATVGKAGESPHAGAMLSLGHALIEFPLVFALWLGAGTVLVLTPVKIGLGALGGAVMIWMSWGMLRSFRDVRLENTATKHSSLHAGIMLSAGNPYFLLWWVTVGGALIIRATEFGIPGLLAFAVVHWTCDLLWLYALSAAVYRGGMVFGQRFQKIVSLLCAIFLLLFGLRFVFDAGRQLL